MGWFNVGSVNSEITFFDCVDPALFFWRNCMPAGVGYRTGAKAGSGLVRLVQESVRDETEQPREQLVIKNPAEEYTLGSMLKARWVSWRDARRQQEDQWLVNMRQFYSQYENEIDASIKEGRSKTFVGITRMKVMVAFSRLVEIFFPATGSKHWEITPTPEPTLAQTGTNEEVTPDISTGIPDAAQVDTEESPAEKATKGMSTKIDDQLVEADYDVTFLESLLESVILGSGCLKSASAKIEREFAWIKTEDGKVWKFQPRESDTIKPLIEGPSVFDVYPDPNAASMKSGIGCFQRHVLNRHEVRNLGLLAGFKKDDINLYLLEHASGDHVDETHEIERRKLAHQIHLIEENLRYDVFEFWGYVDGADLRSVGVEISEEGMSQEFMANVWMIGSTVIKGVLDTSSDEDISFFIFPYEKIVKRIFGRGLPEIMADSQEILNGAGRRLVDDVALLGPQIELDADNADPTTIKNANNVFPFKVWLRDGGDSLSPLLRVHNLTSVSKELGEIITMFRRFIDEETNLPTAFSGGKQPGAGGRETVGGTKMLMTAANVVGRSIVKNIDKYAITPLITKLYMFNMQWSDDDEIKGDMKIHARGSSILLAQEVQTTQMINLLNITNNPTDLQITKRANMIRKVASNSGIDPDDVVKSKEEIDALSKDPVKIKLDELSIQKSTLENQEVSAKIDVQQAEVRKIEAAIDNDEELLRLKAIELQGKEIEAAAQLELQEKELDADIAANKGETVGSKKKKKVAGQKKTTVGATRKTTKNDALKTNNP